MFARLAEIIIEGLAMRRADGFLGEEKTASVEVERNRGSKVIAIARVRRDVAVDLVDPAIEMRERFHRCRRVDLHAEMPHPSESGRDVERDVFACRSAGEPWPRAVAALLLRELS